MSKIILFFIRFYQIVISPFFSPACRYYPSCSQYMIQSIKKRGVLIGVMFGAARILRCNPWSKHRYWDPVK